jgi:hypothetical protein
LIPPALNTAAQAPCKMPEVPTLTVLRSAFVSVPPASRSTPSAAAPTNVSALVIVSPAPNGIPMRYVPKKMMTDVRGWIFHTGRFRI